MEQTQEPVVTSEKVNCSCGKSITKKNLATHCKTEGHLKSLGDAISSAVAAVGTTITPPVLATPNANSGNVGLVGLAGAPPKLGSAELKLKQRFDDIESSLADNNEALEDILEIVEALYEKLIGPLPPIDGSDK